uniref:separase n=1 Tax=Megaselia scalaris TaxID=36166 RepID=T1GBX4_MEGSC
MYSTFADISINFKEYIVFSGEKTKANLEKYMRTCKNFEENIEKVKRSFKNFLGPFATLFAGNVPRNCSTQQKKIFQEVDEFCDRFPKISTRNRVFLSLFSRQVDKLRPEDIKMAGKLLSEGDTNLQEKVCRFSCFDTLAKLYKKYEPNIKNGYLAINIKNGTAVVNPDGNLPDNEKRMKLFFEYWMPSWNVLFNTKPTPEDFEKFFQSDCYIYMGHGHGSQLLSGSKISEMNVNAVVFLFGCDSVRLTSMGHHAEMIASHIYYHNALCPAVVGSLVIGLDLSMDVLSTQIISSWIASKKTKHWSTMNMKAWKDGTIQQNPNSTAATPSHERRLACAVAKARAYESEKNYNKVGLVYRGLPVYNVSRSKM